LKERPAAYDYPLGHQDDAQSAQVRQEKAKRTVAINGLQDSSAPLKRWLETLSRIMVQEQLITGQQ
jgi:hypothetical protein